MKSIIILALVAVILIAGCVADSGESAPGRQKPTGANTTGNAAANEPPKNPETIDPASIFKKCPSGSIRITGVTVDSSGAVMATVQNTGGITLNLTGAFAKTKTGLVTVADDTPVNDVAPGARAIVSFSGSGISKCPSDFGSVSVNTFCEASDTFSGPPECV